MKRFLKWLLISLAVLFVLAIVGLVILYQSRDAIMGRLVARTIREQTGMEAEIGSFHFGLREPVVSIKDFKLRNPAGFGDTPFLVIPEVLVEYDPVALQQKKIHLIRVRFNLGELDIVKNAAGKTNLLEFGLALPNKESKEKKDSGLAEIKKRTGQDFEGVDELTVSIGTARFIDLKNPQNNREQKIGIENWKLKNVKTLYDLGALALLLSLRSDGFFKDVFGASVLDGWK